MPEHDESTSNASGGHFGGVDGDGRVLGSDANTHNETSSKQALPGGGKGGTDGGRRETAGRNKDLTATAKVVIERIDNPGATTIINTRTCLSPKKNTSTVTKKEKLT